MTVAANDSLDHGTAVKEASYLYSPSYLEVVLLETHIQDRE